MTWDCKDGTPEEDHDWRLQTDDFGDPGVINGCGVIYYMQCRQCRKEREANEQEIQDAYNDHEDFYFYD